MVFVKFLLRFDMKKKTKTAKAPNIKSKLKELLSAIKKQDILLADEIAKKLLISYPNNIDILIPAYEVKMALNEEAEGLKLIDRAIKASSNPEPFIPIALNRLKERNFNAARQISSSIVEKYKKNAIAFEILAVALKNQGLYEDAIKQFQNSIRLNKKSYLTWMNMGNAYMSSSKYGEASRCFEEALSISSDTIEARRLLAVCHIRSGDNKKAIEILNKALSIEPNNPSLLHDLAAASHNINDYNSAIETIKRALSIEPNSMYLLKTFDTIARKIRMQELN